MDLFDIVIVWDPIGGSQICVMEDVVFLVLSLLVVIRPKVFVINAK